MTDTRLLPLRRVAELVHRSRDWLDASTVATARAIVDRVRAGGRGAVEALSVEFGEREPDAPLTLGPAALRQAFEALDAESQERLGRVAGRIEAFARAQRRALGDLTVDIPGGRAGHTMRPVGTAGCYAPGGRYPLPSTVLMTAVTARVAGVGTVWVASPRPSPLVLAAAAVAGADGLLVAGGAHAIAALGLGIDGVPRCDVVVGPGNRYVSAAKQLLTGEVGIDMLAGPTELVVLADETADAQLVAADVLAQAEHDLDALPIVVTTSRALADAVEAALCTQLATLPTAAVARVALGRGGVLLAGNLDTAIAWCNALAPEHLALMMRDPSSVQPRLQHAGALFVGGASAEVFGDYGAGPNHVLPTAGTARFTAGLSVFTFLRAQTWLEFDGSGAPDELIGDASWLARAEGLEAHARAAELRQNK